MFADFSLGLDLDDDDALVPGQSCPVSGASCINPAAITSRHAHSPSLHMGPYTARPTDGTQAGPGARPPAPYGNSQLAGKAQQHQPSSSLDSGSLPGHLTASGKPQPDPESASDISLRQASPPRSSSPSAQLQSIAEEGPEDGQEYPPKQGRLRPTTDPSSGPAAGDMGPQQGATSGQAKQPASEDADLLLDPAKQGEEQLLDQGDRLQQQLLEQRQDGLQQTRSNPAQHEQLGLHVQHVQQLDAALAGSQHQMSQPLGIPPKPSRQSLDADNAASKAQQSSLEEHCGDGSRYSSAPTCHMPKCSMTQHPGTRSGRIACLSCQCLP